MESASYEMNEKKLEIRRESLSHSFSCDGYERLHDEAMDKISVSIYSDCEEAFSGNSRSSLTKASENHEKKMKISLSQEQLRLNGNSKNFLSVLSIPKSTKKSASFSAVDKRDGRKLVKINLESPILPETLDATEAKTVKSSDNLNVNQVITVTPPIITADAKERDEIIYAVPQKSFTLQMPHSSRKERNEIKTSSASLTSSKSVATALTSSSTTELNFKHPLSFYCKICGNLLNDPRTLDCLHTFCMQCLARLDVTNDLQNNQFWRKISDCSSKYLKRRITAF
jgi:zinc finger of C3HC4-type, RING